MQLRWGELSSFWPVPPIRLISWTWCLQRRRTYCPILSTSQFSHRAGWNLNVLYSFLFPKWGHSLQSFQSEAGLVPTSDMAPIISSPWNAWVRPGPPSVQNALECQSSQWGRICQLASRASARSALPSMVVRNGSYLEDWREWKKCKDTPHQETRFWSNI